MTIDIDFQPHFTPPEISDVSPTGIQPAKITSAGVPPEECRQLADLPPRKVNPSIETDVLERAIENARTSYK